MTNDLTAVIPWCNRLELQQTLPDNMEVFGTCEVVVVNVGGDLRTLSGILHKSHYQNLTVLDVPIQAFNKCLALNIGVWHSHTDNILLLDADILITEDLLSEAQSALDRNTFVTVPKGRESDPARHPQTLHSTPFIAERLQITELTFADGRTATVEFWQGSCGRSLAGLMLLRKADYLAVEGSNSKLFGWGFEDYDLQIRLQTHLGLRRVSATNAAAHMTHEIPKLATRSASENRNLRVALASYASGNFLGTYSTDVSVWREKTRIARPPLAT